jgi:hypothetical protein
MAQAIINLLLQGRRISEDVIAGGVKREEKKKGKM